MKLLVLGGTHHVGRSVVEVALARGHSVATLTRGVSGPPASGALALHANRRDPVSLAAALGSRSWDAAVDTWSAAPRAVHDSAALLTTRVAHYSYVSSRSVYQWPMPIGLDETGPVVDGDPLSADNSDYAKSKRGGELAVLEAFPQRSLVARAGLILGPYERVGRMPWWLRRMERGGRVLCPGPQGLPLQYLDGRDLAEWIVTAAEESVTGIYNTVSRPGHTTMGELLEAARFVTGGRAELVWVSPSFIEQAAISAWTELPVWVPPDGEEAGLHNGDVSAAFERGLHCRPMVETIKDTWDWLQIEGDPPSLSDGTIGLAPEKEAAALAVEDSHRAAYERSKAR